MFEDTCNYMKSCTLMRQVINEINEIDFNNTQDRHTFTTDMRGERRFISTIARRFDSLGALPRGQRQTGGQNPFDPADNLESSYAKEALHRWFGRLFTGKLEAVSVARFEELTGLRIEGPDGSMVDDLPTIQRWLNRTLALPIGEQNGSFDEVLGLVEARIDAARQASTLELGVETIAIEHFEVLSDTLLRTGDRAILIDAMDPLLHQFGHTAAQSQWPGAERPGGVGDAQAPARGVDQVGIKIARGIEGLGLTRDGCRTTAGFGRRANISPWVLLHAHRDPTVRGAFCTLRRAT